MRWMKGPGGCCSPRHGVPCNSRDGGSRCVGLNGLVDVHCTSTRQTLTLPPHPPPLRVYMSVQSESVRVCVYTQVECESCSMSVECLLFLNPVSALELEGLTALI